MQIIFIFPDIINEDRKEDIVERENMVPFHPLHEADYKREDDEAEDDDGFLHDHVRSFRASLAVTT